MYLEISGAQSNAKEQKETREYLLLVHNKINIKTESKCLETFIPVQQSDSMYVNLIIKQENALYSLFILCLKSLSFSLYFTKSLVYNKFGEKLVFHLRNIEKDRHRS